MTRKSRRAKLVRTKVTRVARVRPQPSVRQVVREALRPNRLSEAEVTDVLDLIARVNAAEDEGKS